MTDVTNQTKALSGTNTHAETGKTVALLKGQPLGKLPEDLFIPPDALEVFLEAFEGPLDLLLYLIRKQQLDILDLPVAEITSQYMQYVELMQELKLELAAEYLVMAAMLVEIKSRLLLPKPESQTTDEETDPRVELIRRLKEYEVFKLAAERLDDLPRLERELFVAGANMCEPAAIRVEYPPLGLKELVLAMGGVMKRAASFEQHRITRQTLSTRERMSHILVRLQEKPFISFSQLITIEEGRSGVVVTFLALLELVKLAQIEVIQASHDSELQLTLRTRETSDDSHPQDDY